jgi:glycosyltransferase involved in cell wall biosynthesis
VISQRNRGLAGARNAGIRAAAGEYIAFLDADDLWTSDKLARHVAHLESQPDVGVSYCQSAFVDDEARPMGALQAPKLVSIRPEDVFLRNPVGNGSAPVIRRAVFDAIAFASPQDSGEAWYFDETFRQSEDIECWTRIALTTGWAFEGLGAPLTLYRVNSGGLSANLEKQFASWERMVSKTADYAPAFIAEWGSQARGFQLRYLARRAVRMGDARQALRLMWAAVKSHPGMLRQEPGRTLVTLAAAVAQLALPVSVWKRAEAAGLRMAGALARRATAPV